MADGMSPRVGGELRFRVTKLLLAFALLFFAGFSPALALTLQGTVTHVDSGETLADIKVVVGGEDATTNSKGEYELEIEPAGTQPITFDDTKNPARYLPIEGSIEPTSIPGPNGIIIPWLSYDGELLPANEDNTAIILNMTMAPVPPPPVTVITGKVVDELGEPLENIVVSGTVSTNGGLPVDLAPACSVGRPAFAKRNP